jgi:two-component system chemotaxis response regulator CheB
LKAEHPKDGEPLRHGLIYVAPPGRHLLVKRGTVRVVNGPNENGHRPAVDPLFRTAARAHGRRTMGVVLSGSLDDGTAGLAAIKAHGGAALVQDPADALFPGMPQSAIDNVDVDFTGNPAALAQELVRRTMELERQPGHPEPEEDCPEELDVVEMDSGSPAPERWAATPSPFSCPECHGILFERKDAHGVEMRARVIRDALQSGGGSAVA